MLHHQSSFYLYLVNVVNQFIDQEEKISGGGAESFGKQWVPGDIVGVFLDLVDHTISKKGTLFLSSFGFHSLLTEFA